MPEQNTFKTAVFGGFDKDDVLKYIDAMTMEFTNTEEQLGDEVAAAQRELSEKEDELREQVGVGDELRARYLELQGQLQAAAAQIKSLQSELAAVRGYSAEQEKELAIVKEQNRLLADQVERSKEENERAEAAAGEWSAALDAAGESARVMIAGAGAGAKNMVAEAERSAAEVNGELEQFCGEVAKLRKFVGDSMAVLGQRLEYIDKAAGEARLDTGKRSAQRDEIDRRCAEMTGALGGRIASLKGPFFQ